MVGYSNITYFFKYSIKYAFVFVLYILFVCNQTAIGQDIVVGKKALIQSEILNEKREIWIHIPQSYYNTGIQPATYPVLYLLDGDWQFQYLVAAQEALSGGMYNYMPEMIIVGIANTDRSRDLTPTNGFVIHSGEKIHTTSGGADRFWAFIDQELKPYIQNNYRTNDYNLLTGHSFGGLFTIYSMLTHPKSFNAYIAIDPSIWWDNKYTFNLAKESWNKLELNGTVLYLAMANSDPTEKDKLGHSETIKDFSEDFLSAKNNNGLRSKWEFFASEDHGTISLPAIYSGLKYIFKGYCVPVKKIVNQPNIIQSHFQQVSDSIGFTMHPTELWLNQIISYCKKVKKEEAVCELELYKAKLYPSKVK